MVILNEVRFLTYTNAIMQILKTTNMSIDENNLRLKKILSAKLLLESEGYFVQNLWHTDDVCQNYDVDQDEALEILEDALTSGRITTQIFEAIDSVADQNGYEKKSES
tara:strand:+ start:310 stop:633 length:324 start_codon:yes stop_codon:yes gene_type:complete